MNRKTVFVVGAGASKEFGGSGSMPVGSELAVQIESALSSELQNYRGGGHAPVIGAIAQSGGFGDVHRSAIERIRDGIQSVDSIDQFIDQWRDVPELARIAKICIAERILMAERSSLLADLLSPQQNGNASILRSLRDT